MSIETPASIQRKADSLREWFAALVSSYPDDRQIVVIARQYDDWHHRISESLLNRLFASSVIPELESWQRRYAAEYERLRASYPDIPTTAPSPDVIFEPTSPPSPWPKAIIAGSVAVGLIAIAIMRK